VAYHISLYSTKQSHSHSILHCSHKIREWILEKWQPTFYISDQYTHRVYCV